MRCRVERTRERSPASVVLVGESKVVFSTTRADLVKARQVQRMFDQVHQPPSRRPHPSSSVPRHMPVRLSPFSGQERPCRQFYEKQGVSHGEGTPSLSRLSKARHRCHLASHGCHDFSVFALSFFDALSLIKNDLSPKRLLLTRPSSPARVNFGQRRAM